MYGTINFVILMGLIVISDSWAFQSVMQQKQQRVTTTTTSLDMMQGRREVFAAIALLPFVALGEPAFGKGSTFFYDDQIEKKAPEPSQLPTGGKLDLNSAFVGDYASFPGMYPHAAGQLASHGPYRKVSDIYDIPTLTENDKKMFRKYESEFTVNPPGRTFGERINARVST